MSEEIHVEEHSSPIKTPTQLIVVVVLVHQAGSGWWKDAGF
jgi:hypothetical protein